MSDFEKAYIELNDAQKEAVKAIEGPVLVIAGPGTGKTQLLGMRVANILDKTDTQPRNILCLTFTENGATNMRDRLTRFIGQDAYDVNISTYHAFGGDLIRRFPEYFEETRLENPVDPLGQYQIVAAIVEELRYDNPLKQTQYHVRDLIATISEVKRALLSAEDLRDIAFENEQFTEQGSQRVAIALEEVAALARMPVKSDKVLPHFEAALDGLRSLVPEKPASEQFGSLAHTAVGGLESALEKAAEIGKAKPLTDWKNTWLAKDKDNRFIITGEIKNRRIRALADVFESYTSALEARGLYDFDDMILRSIETLERHEDFRFSLQEQYLYLLLDEFQDTNAAQLRLVELLTNNPVSEGRPNVLAVGDDDQAIYAFQGARYSNMLEFYEMYRDVKVINLTENYRSHADVLHTAGAIAEQIEARLHHHFPGSSKTLIPANKKLSGSARLHRREFLSDVAEYDWIAKEIAKLIKEGTKPSEIAVLATGHKHLEPLVAYLNEQQVPVRYEKRENILETPIVRQLLTMSKLVLALQRGDYALADSLWPEVLSYDFWQIPLKDIWKFSWKVRDSKGELTWCSALLDDEQLQKPAQLLIALSAKAGDETLEMMLDYLIGSLELDVHESNGETLQSPLREYYTSETMRKERPEAFYETLSHLTVLRAKLREFQRTQEDALTLKHLITFVEMYEAAEQRMINASPYTQAADAVQLMTVFKAKGLEFEHVFLPRTLDDVWGESSRGNSNKISLPTNLAPIRHAGANQDERLRIFFVAITRAKIGLHITSFTTSYSGKTTKRLKYLNEQEQPDGEHRALSLPEHAQTIHHDGHEAPTLETLEQHWHARHLKGIGEVQLRTLLQDRLERYQLSPTHVGDFVDIENCGPEQFFLKTFLNFPGAPSINVQFGNAIHETLEWIQRQHDVKHSLPNTAAITTRFTDAMQAKKLSAGQTERLIHRGEAALQRYMSERGSMFALSAKAEKSFRSEGVFVGKAHLAGKIDRMEIDETNKTITVVDYKTGNSHPKWSKTLKLHKYAQQLYCYKILIEGSHSYKQYTVNTGRVEFIEPDDDGNIHALEISFKPEETERTKQLLQAVWQHVCALEMPDISGYGTDINGMLRFEQDLIEGMNKT